MKPPDSAAPSKPQLLPRRKNARAIVEDSRKRHFCRTPINVTRFLRFTVEESLLGQGDKLKQSGSWRPGLTYDPKIDAVVRL